MAWVKISDGLHAHPKIREAGIPASGLFLWGLSYSAAYGLDGFLPHMWVHDVLSTAEERELPNTLVACRLWEPIEGGFMIHDYLDYNVSKADGADLSARKADAGKKGMAKRWG